MLAVHFGAGNIGRGFIGLLLYQSNYHTTFVDVIEKVINEINEKKQYKVVLAAENSDEQIVKNIDGINSVTHPEKVIEAIKHADVVTTAVGPNILPIISELIAKGLQERASESKKPLNMIACENMVGGSALLKENVYKHISDQEHPIFDEIYGFPNAAVDRIVPNQVNEDPLQVSVEPYFEWVVETSTMKGEQPDIQGITYVEDLAPYIERKLFTVNTGHTVPAYVGRYMGYETIADAMKDDKVEEILQGALKESGEALIQTYGFNREEHQTYINKIMNRFKNPHISDEVIRVGRGPIRKLGAKDRLVRPAIMHMEVTGKVPEFLATVIASALQFDYDQDTEAVELQKMISEQGFEKTLQNVSGLEEGHPLVQEVMKKLEEITALKKA